MSNNESIKKLLNDKIQNQLDKGAVTYGKEVPLDGSRNHLLDALEEVLDCSVYIAAKIVEIKQMEEK